MSQNLLDNNGVTKNVLHSWKDDIRAGLKYRLMYGRSKDWDSYRNMYRGFWGKETVPVNPPDILP